MFLSTLVPLRQIIPIWAASGQKRLRSTVIQGDSEGKVNSLGGDGIGHCEKSNIWTCV
jgi:hypothetical protein